MVRIPATTRLALWVCVVCLAWPTAMAWAMGGGSSNGELNLPIPAAAVRVQLTDRTGRAYTVERFSWEGKLYLQGVFGAAKLSIPFAKIRFIKGLAADPSSPGKAMAEVALVTGETVKLAVDPGSRCYGMTPYGPMEILFKDVAEIRM
ncbi:MAG: hypothetical protein OEV94_03010 [Deltaproteobacteria bacterium]|nr:hypothetical protein [Deltaproteobacteria bacterium]